MNISLELVRTTLRGVLGHDSFVGSFIASAEASDACATASITTEGVLRYNPAFVSEYVQTEADLVCLVMHELMHPLFGHFVHGPGYLENLAADIVINACLSTLYVEASDWGSLFRRFYAGQGLEGLLRPGSRMRNSRYGRLYDAFYDGGWSREGRLSTGEVIQTLKVLAPPTGAKPLLLLGSHGSGESSAAEQGGRFPAGVLARIAEDLKRSAMPASAHGAGHASHLYSLFVEVLETHCSLRRTLLLRFATRRRWDRFLEPVRRPRVTVSPVPIKPGKRDLVLLAAGIPPLQYRAEARGIALERRGLALYLDVSGSVNDHLPRIIGILRGLRNDLRSAFLFSNRVVEVPFHALLRGALQTTHGTDFNCVARSILDQGYDRAVVMTDGHAALDPALQRELARRKTRLLTVLFGGRKDCPGFQGLGEVVQLEHIVR